MNAPPQSSGDSMADKPQDAVEKSTRAYSITTIIGLRILLILVLGVVWELAVRKGFLDPFFVSSPSAIMSRTIEWIVDGTIFLDTLVTLYEAAVGFVLAAVFGIAAGIVLARYPLADEVLRPFIDVLNSIPRIALAPLFVLWFGLAVQAKIALVFSVAVFSFLINAYSGAKSVDPEYVRMARSLGASRRDVVRKIVMPSIVPWLLAGARLGVAYSLAAAVIGEIISANRGLGFRIGFASGVLDTAGQFAALFILALVAWAANTGVERLERKLLGWKEIEDRGGGTP